MNDNKNEQCSKGYRRQGDQCVAIMSAFRAPQYRSIFGVDPPPDPPDPPDPPVPPIPPTPPPSPSNGGNSARAGNDNRANIKIPNSVTNNAQLTPATAVGLSLAGAGAVGGLAGGLLPPSTVIGLPKGKAGYEWHRRFSKSSISLRDLGAVGGVE